MPVSVITNQINLLICNMKEIDVIKSRFDLLKSMEVISEKLEDERFKIAVVGEFSSGKSTFINAMIGKDILLHSVEETTAAITLIHNVKETDSRIGTGKITYADGRIMQFQEFSDLRRYTTTVSEMNVANEVRCVELYVNFLGIDYPVTIVDTPGLNGIADRHRELTISEVKKAHACIYLLSIKGLTAFDVGIIRILKAYQSEFIFVQNFIDELKETEGETPQKKKDMILSILGMEFPGEKEFHYTISAVSALAALAGKDKEIQYLYSGDVEEIKDMDREILYEKSNFQELEDIIRNYFLSGRYKKIMAESVLCSLESMIQGLLPVLYRLEEQGRELLQGDSRNERIRRAKNKLEKLNHVYELNKKKLDNFIISRDKENRAAYKKKIAIEFSQIYDKICELIEEEIKIYDDFWRIENISGKNTGEYFSEKVSNDINTRILPELNQDMDTGYQVLYSDALLRAGDYAGEIGGLGEDKLSVIRIQSNSNVDIGFEDKLTELNKSKSRFKSESQKILELQKNMQAAESRKKQMCSEIAQEERILSEQQEEYERKKSQIGKQPAVEYAEVEKEKIVERTGFLHKTKDFFLEPQKEIYYETVEDDTKLQEWRKKRLKIENDFLYTKSEKDRKIAKLKYKLEDLEKNQKLNAINYEKIKKKAEQLKKDIQAGEYEYQTYLKNAKDEFCRNQKKSLKENFYQILLDENLPECKLIDFGDYIDQSSEQNIPQIQYKVLQCFEAEIAENKKRIHFVISDNREELEKQFSVDAKDIEKLKNIQEKINSIRRNCL